MKKTLIELLEKRNDIHEDIDLIEFDINECDSEDESLPHDLRVLYDKLKRLNKKIKKSLKNELENI